MHATSLDRSPRALEPDPQGVREDPGDIDGLAATIAEYGLLQRSALSISGVAATGWCMAIDGGLLR
jgi:hypothetical protein